jgi:hypothetical protein
MLALYSRVRRAQLLCLFLAWPFILLADTASRPDSVTADGGRYYGPMVDGKFHGRGRIEWDNGDRYEGEFAKGLFSGKGRFDSRSGNVYEGDFRDGFMDGHGRMRMADGSLYVGTFRDDYFNGQGRYEMPDGEVYDGTFANGHFHGEGRFTDADGEYRGEFRQGRYWGQGEISIAEGGKYRGDFVRGRFQGKGRFENRDGETFTGDFDKGEFNGTGTHARRDGSRHEGRFVNWRPHGPGRYIDAAGSVYEGQFIEGQMEGSGRFAGKDGTLYDGEFKQWLFDGQGQLRLANGDTYKGGFSRGLYEGRGTLTYAKPQADGRTQESGIWRFGRLLAHEDLQKAAIKVETALYNQRRLLDNALAALTPRDPKKINLYLLAVAGDGSQEVFRREVEFVRDHFARRFATEGRSLLLINSRNTVDTIPMATVTSIRESLAAIAARMDKEKDILFLFLSSHGSREHELALNQNNMTLRGLSAKHLAALIKETGIRWKVVVVSACYGGGFIDPIKDPRTLVIAAARYDRQSFGCADENDFTYFGRAFFKDALPQSASFQEAFRKAERLVAERERTDGNPGDKKDAGNYSLPQMFNPGLMEKHLQLWWAEATQNRN